MESEQPSSKRGRGVARVVSLTAPCSPIERTVSEKGASTQFFHDQKGSYHLNTRLYPVPTMPYPTPPASSSSSSSTRKASEAGSDGSPQIRGIDGTNHCRPGIIQQQSGTNVMPLRNRRQTASLEPLSNITTDSSVHAAHLSNPTSSSHPSTTPSTPSSDVPTISALSSLNSHLELVKLTDGVASPYIKNTPPLTPRALSNDGSELAKQTPHTNNQESDKSRTGSANLFPTPHSSPPVGPPKGKLFVTISGARGLRPSYSPYAVCVFEWIESIARGPKQEEADMENEPRKKEHLLGGVPIRKAGSEMGRSMAIPMKSRQSSTTSLSDQKDFNGGRCVTDPTWNHEAVLCA